MAVYETEDEQVEALKKWWKENGASAVAGVVIGLGLLFGWRWWQDYSVQQAQLASSIYEQVMFALEKEEISPARQVADKLLSEYSGSSYAVLTALTLAHHDLKAGEIDTSHARLQWVIDNSSLAGLTHIARLRKARLFLSQEKVADAKNMIEGVPKDQFKGAYAELQGDIAMAQNQTDAARTAYAEALISKDLSVKHHEWVQMKLDDLGVEKGTRFEANAPLSVHGSPTTAQDNTLTINDPANQTSSEAETPISATGNPSTTPDNALTITEPVTKVSQDKKSVGAIGNPTTIPDNVLTITAPLTKERLGKALAGTLGNPTTTLDNASTVTKPATQDK